MSALFVFMLGSFVLTAAASFAPFTNIERYYTNADSSRMVHFFWRDGKLRCYVYGDGHSIREAMASEVAGSIAQLEDATLKFAIDVCTRIELPYVVLRGTEQNVSRAIIYPGTKWCGAGSVAEDWDDLGVHWQTDSCCRQHDFCPEFILVGEEKYGLHNKYIGTVSHCDCDAEFIDCLKSTNLPVSDNVGKIFFSFLAVPCFREEHPIVRCLEHGGPGGKRCLKYEFDHSKPKMWQFFDAKVY